MPRHLSIRLRLTLWYAAVMLLAFSLFGATMWWSLEHRLLAGVDTRLAQRMHGAHNALGAEAEIASRAQLQQELAEFAGEIPDGVLLQLVDPKGAIIAPHPRQAPLPRGGPVTAYTTQLAGRPFRVLTGPLETAGDTYQVVLAAPLDEVRAVMHDFRQLLLLLIPAALLLACAGGYWLSLRALRPVDAITAVARSISLRNLSRRIAVPPTGDELQRMAETWNQVLERLDVAVQRVRQFTADASHELRTPLALIRANAELALRKERPPQEYRHALQEIAGQAAYLTDLTESMLSIARADFEGFDMPLSPTRLDLLAAEEVRQYQARAAEKSVHLAAGAEGFPTQVPANPDGLRRLLRILIDNALRHTPAGGRITVSALCRDGRAELSVEDTGEGIAPADLPHIFERFYRGDQTRASGSGFGLGLAIAQAIAQAHGTRITATSTPGAGARFSLLFSQSSD